MKKSLLFLFWILFFNSMGILNVYAIMPGMQKLFTKDGQRYFIYIPEKAIKNPHQSRIFVYIHGYNGRKDTINQIKRLQRKTKRWAKVAELHNWVVIVPHFTSKLFHNDYQRLNLLGKRRADLRLLDLVDKVGKMLPDLRKKKILLWGFSGGGQFTHRFVMIHPHRIYRAVAGGAGWYAFPDEKLPWPIGIKPESLPHGIKINLKEFLESKMLIMVGKDDIDGSAFRRKYRKGGETYNLRKIQGYGRFHRAKNYFQALIKLAREKGLKTNMSFYAEPGVKHGVNKMMKKKLIEFLTQD